LVVTGADFLVVVGAAVVVVAAGVVVVGAGVVVVGAAVVVVGAASVTTGAGRTTAASFLSLLRPTTPTTELEGAGAAFTTVGFSVKISTNLTGCSSVIGFLLGL